MANELHRHPLTRRRILLGATAIAANALAAACGQEPTASNGASNTSPTPAPTRIVIVPTPLPSPTLLPPPSSPTATPVGGVARGFATPMGAPTAPLIVFLGGYYAVTNPSLQRTESLPPQTMALLPPATYDAVNDSAQNETLDALYNRAPTSIDPLYAASRRKNILVIFAGINDLYFGASPAEAFAKMVMVGQARRQVGWKIVWLTLLPAWDMRKGEDYVTERQALNAMMCTNRASFADALADVGGDPIMGVEGVEADRTYYLDDGWNYTAKGYRIIAGYVQKAILTL